MSEVERKMRNLSLRKDRVRVKVKGTSEVPRLSVKISNLHVMAQLVDDEKHKTLVYATTVGQKLTGSKTEKATVIGKQIAEKAKKVKVKKVVFDRGSRKYAQRLNALATAAREGGLEF